MLGQRVEGWGGVQPHPPVNCENKTLSWLCGEAEIGDYKSFEGRNYSLGLIIGLGTRGEAEDRGGTGWGSDLKSLHWNADEREDIHL